MYRVALLVLVFSLCVQCEFVELPYNLETTLGLSRSAQWTVGVDGDFNLSGFTSDVHNQAQLLFTPTVEGNDGFYFSTRVFRTGSLFETQSAFINDATLLGVGWRVKSSIFILTHVPIARYVMEFYWELGSIGVADRDVLIPNFDVTFAAPQTVFPNAAWAIISTSSGDNILTTADRWVILQEDGDSRIPENIVDGYTLIYFYQPFTGTERPISITFSSVDLQFTFSISVPEGEVYKLMFFVEFGSTLPALLAQVGKYDLTSTIPATLIAGIPKSELSEIVNFQFVDPLDGIPVPASFNNLCKISSEIRDRSSARHPTKKHYFQQPWFC